jgi:hypothetical protein
MASKEEARPRDKDADCEIIFRKTITLKNGRILIAAEYGLEAFPIRVRRDS